MYKKLKKLKNGKIVPEHYTEQRWKSEREEIKQNGYCEVVNDGRIIQMEAIGIKPFIEDTLEKVNNFYDLNLKKIEFVYFA